MNGHVYDNDCDADCNVCGNVREVADHVYDNACDADCNVCGDTRKVDGHKYDNDCDADCNVCGATREVADHVYDNDCDVDCNNCGDVREVADHVYDNACDADCNTCGVTREVADHVYDNEEDADCNECGAIRYVGAMPTFSVDSVTTRVGKTFTVAVRVENNPGIVSAKLAVSYDADKLQLLSYEVQDFAGLSYGPAENNPFIVNWYDTLNDNNTTNGAFVLLTFEVKADAAFGPTDISVSYDPEDVYDFDFENVAFDTVSGTVDIVEYISGDLNDDDIINNKDVGELQRFVNGWGVDINQLAADVNRDGLINNKDLGILKRYVNGWDIELK